MREKPPRAPRSSLPASPHRVVVVGGGITGLTAAYRLLRAGRTATGAPFSVTVLRGARAPRREHPHRAARRVRARRRARRLHRRAPAGHPALQGARPTCGRLMGTTEREPQGLHLPGRRPPPLPEGVVLGASPPSDSRSRRASSLHLGWASCAWGSTSCSPPPRTRATSPIEPLSSAAASAARRWSAWPSRSSAGSTRATSTPSASRPPSPSSTSSRTSTGASSAAPWR